MSKKIVRALRCKWWMPAQIKNPPALRQVGSKNLLLYPHAGAHIQQQAQTGVVIRMKIGYAGQSLASNSL
ncbi:MAG TPA: hypothetical protein VFA90_09445 [Terriglobales bacterium]|nr:hypothetical protein [Terriglobales bacterium]